jgi:hypothetical protein
MIDQTLYAVCIRKTAVHDWGMAVDSNGQPVAMTIGQLVGEKLGEWLKTEPEIFVKITLNEFRDDLKSDQANSKYVKMLGWNYAEAARLVERDGAIFVLTTHPVWEARPYSFSQTRDDDDYALKLLRDIYSIRGGNILLEEFDPQKHVKGYKPDVEYKTKV